MYELETALKQFEMRSNDPKKILIVSPVKFTPRESSWNLAVKSGTISE
jgi:hypothetical protein